MFLRIIMVFTLLLAMNLYAQETVKFEQPVLISSAGQSADVTLASMLLKKGKIEHKTVAIAKESDLEGMKTLMIVPGFSSKGLGAAGISREEELKRVQNLIKAAKDKKIKILMVHLGGKARRGTQSDDFNTMAAESSRTMVVVSQGDEDGLFSKIAKDKKITIHLVEKIALALDPIKALF